jgi:hypothetical protein
MLTKLTQYFNQLINHKFSILAELGDLSKYNYEQMNIILTKWNRKIIEGDSYFDAEWDCKTTRIRIRYNNITKYFIQILEEEWKPFKMIIKRETILHPQKLINYSN